MVDPRTARLWGYRTLFLVLVVLVLFFRLLPLSAQPGPWPLPDVILEALPWPLRDQTWPGADVLLCLALVWVQRRPDHLPAPAIALLFLADDLFSMRPPGLWAMIVLIGTEFLRAREGRTRDLPFWGEWLQVAGVVAAMSTAYWLVTTILFVPQATLGLSVAQMAATVALYPVMGLIVQSVFGLHRAAPGEVDSWGSRI